METLSHLVDGWARAPRKVVASCEKLGRGACSLRTRDYRMGVLEEGLNLLRSRQRAGTPGSETSQYREEEKANAMPSVTASEEGTGQTEPGGESHWGCGVVGLPPIPRAGSRSCLEWHAAEGESPVGVTAQDTRGRILSRMPWDWRPKLGVTNSQP